MPYEVIKTNGRPMLRARRAAVYRPLDVDRLRSALRLPADAGAVAINRALARPVMASRKAQAPLDRDGLCRCLNLPVSASDVDINRALGHPAKPKVAQAKPRKAAATPVRAAAMSSRLRRDVDSGSLLYAGAPVSLGPDGEPRVFTLDGWMSVQTFEASGGTPDDVFEAIGVTRLAPNGPLAKLFRQGA